MSLISSDMQLGWVSAGFSNQQVCKLTARRNAEAWMPASKSLVPVSELLLHRWIFLDPTFCCWQCTHKTFKKWRRRTFVGQFRVTYSRGKTLCKMGWGPCRSCIESIKFASPGRTLRDALQPVMTRTGTWQSSLRPVFRAWQSRSTARVVPCTLHSGIRLPKSVVSAAKRKSWSGTPDD